MYSKAPIIRTEHWAVWAVHSMYCRTGISTGTYNRNFRVICIQEPKKYASGDRSPFLAFFARKLTMDKKQIDNSVCLLTDDFSQQQFLKNANSTNIIFYNILSIRVHQDHAYKSCAMITRLNMSGNP